MKPTMNWIIKDNVKTLRDPSLDVTFPLTKEQEKYVERMVQYIDASFTGEYEKYNLKPGIGIAAPQVGLNYKIIYIRLVENDVEHKLLLANPRIVSESLQVVYIEQGEGCLSVDEEKEGIIPRKQRVIVEAFDMNLKKNVKIDATGILAVCLQHEIDHLKGKLFFDHIEKKPRPDWIILRK